VSIFGKCDKISKKEQKKCTVIIQKTY